MAKRRSVSRRRNLSYKRTIKKQNVLTQQVKEIKEQVKIAKYSLQRKGILSRNKALDTLGSKSEGILDASEKLLSTSLTGKNSLLKNQELIKKTLDNINKINTPGALREGLGNITLKRNGEVFSLSAEQHKSLYDEYVQRLKQMYKDIEERYPDERNTPPDLVRTRKALKKLHKNNFKTKYRFNDWLNDRQSVNEDINIRGISTQRLRTL